MSSPPTTPSPRASHRQSLTQEPSYTSSTYKPPALYPFKEQRSDSFPLLNSTLAPPAPRHLPEPNQQRFDSSATRQAGPFPPLEVPGESIDTRRSSVYTTGASTASSSPPWVPRFGRGSHDPEAASKRSSIDNSTNYFQTPMQTPSLGVFDGTFAQEPFQRERRDSEAYHSTRPGPRRSSTIGHHTSHQYPDRESLNNDPYPTRSRYPTFPGDRRPSSYEPGGYVGADEPMRMVGGRDSALPTFLMPSPYELQHGKARKRSNLPKQATEIMKTWFEQV